MPLAAADGKKSIKILCSRFWHVHLRTSDILRGSVLGKERLTQATTPAYRGSRARLGGFGAEVILMRINGDS
jgi:hypothetical protein